MISKKLCIVCLCGGIIPTVTSIHHIVRPISSSRTFHFWSLMQGNLRSTPCQKTSKHEPSVCVFANIECGLVYLNDLLPLFNNLVLVFICKSKMCFAMFLDYKRFLAHNLVLNPNSFESHAHIVWMYLCWAFICKYFQASSQFIFVKFFFNKFKTLSKSFGG